MKTTEKLESLWNLLTLIKYEDWQDSQTYCKKNDITRMTLHNWIQKKKLFKIQLDGKNYVAENPAWKTNYIPVD